MRKILYVIGLATLILLSTTVVKASGDVYYINHQHIEMTEDEYNNLLNLGFTENQIAAMDYDEFIANKDIEGNVDAETTRFIKTTTTVRNGIKTTVNYVMTEEELYADLLSNNQGNNYRPNESFYDGYYMDSYREVTSKIVTLEDGYKRYKVDIEWIEMPSYRGNDIIGIGIESAKATIASLIVLRTIWWSGNTEHYSTTCAPKDENTGGSAMFELPSGSISTLETYLYFNIVKKLSAGTVTTLTATGDYAHAFASVDLDDVFDNYSINYITGIEIDDPYTQYYEYLPEVEAYWLGTW